MTDSAGLFTHCKSCGEQVSTFQTECPYCGSRLRERSSSQPLIDAELESLEAQFRDSESSSGKLLRLPKRRPKQQPSAAKRSPSRVGKLRFPAVSALSGRPWATSILVVTSLLGLPLVTLLGREELVFDGSSSTPLWHLATSVFTYISGWHLFVAVAGIAVFGWLWERRLGPLLPFGLFLLGGCGGIYIAAQVDPGALQLGGSGAAMALVSAWIVAELIARKRGTDVDGDLLGAAVFAAVIFVACSLVPGGSIVAVAVGGLVGAAAGAGTSAFER